jgi:quercetin dioxygenase-like cupin family protein
MEIKRNGLQPSNKGPADWFTGAVRIDPLFQTNTPARAAGASVTFEPRARTAWHTHPLGQTLIVTAGCGWVQREGGPIEEIHPGDGLNFDRQTLISWGRGVSVSSELTEPVSSVCFPYFEFSC